MTTFKRKDGFKCDTVVGGLRELYEKRLRPLETQYLFSTFHSPPLDAGDFSSKPMILLLGQYSTGKTTFVKYILGSSFPGMNIGPEPTTDRFSVVMEGNEGIIPGNALVVDAQKPFRPLSRFGSNFLNRFQCCLLKNPVVESITIVDTPGILSGEKQRVDRGYDFTAVVQWFAEMADRIILLFDAHKLDISDEFRRVIESLRGFDDKIRIVLNKADMVDSQQLMRVYGALMWGLGKVLGTPEVVRVHVGSFWDEPLRCPTNKRLFELEAHDLLKDLQALPSNCAIRKLNDFIRRVRLAKEQSESYKSGRGLVKGGVFDVNTGDSPFTVDANLDINRGRYDTDWVVNGFRAEWDQVHAYIIGHLKKEMPSWMGKNKKKQELIQNLDQIYATISRQYQIPLGDFPEIGRMRLMLNDQDFNCFPPLKPKLLEQIDTVLSDKIPRLMQMIPQLFQSLNPVNGRLSGEVIRPHLVASQLPQSVLRHIWQLSDVDRDGHLDADEFALANYLVKLKLDGNELPSTLPAHLIHHRNARKPRTEP
ncbi:hypothetical protein AHF37_01434 [Paragonimus kellicotti]|nr:hypothetical protein AHF37_01434 [Paragonimus kellicotti]